MESHISVEFRSASRVLPVPGMEWGPAQGTRQSDWKKMKKNQPHGIVQGENRTRTTDRRQGARRTEDLERRLAEVEDIARANRRELHLQFQRIAHMQA
jgi:hypothetical protein